MSNNISYAVSETEHGARLDAVTARCSQCGIRTAKRLIADGHVLVNGKIRPPHFKLVAGSCITIGEADADPVASPLTVAAVSKEYLAFVKPAGLHTAQIAGKNTASLEETIASQWRNIHTAIFEQRNDTIPEVLLPILPDQINAASAFCTPLPDKAPSLLSRLDAATSGIVPAATSITAAEKFKKLEAAGHIHKYYLAVIHGTLEEKITIHNSLDMDNRKKTRVLPKDSPDRTRHTEVFPLGNTGIAPLPDAEKTLSFVVACIQRGTRHQIRAHLAHAGFPIFGDALYGEESEAHNLHLHHACLIMPEFSAFCLPTWLPTL